MNNTYNDFEYLNIIKNIINNNEYKERLEKAIYEISNSGIYDYVIESGSKEEDYEKVKNIIEYEKNKKICK